ncbi:hypothetical protein [Roseibium aggregatum]|uniref:hypothetical protein n=1 Tax=Roseibium aggregatum TaxID=187304 RepID=UPI0012F50B38|nr:hypothetical protein [Roseibium aggregatum]
MTEDEIQRKERMEKHCLCLGICFFDGSTQSVQRHSAGRTGRSKVRVVQLQRFLPDLQNQHRQVIQKQRNFGALFFPALSFLLMLP